MGDLSTSSIFHVIDSKIFYKLFFGCPSLRDYGIGALTFHQYLKYYRGGEKNISNNVKPFTEAESHFAILSSLKKTMHLSRQCHQ